MSVYAKVRDLPEALQSALLGLKYGRADIEVCASETASRHYHGWTGQRGFCAIVDLATGHTTYEQGSWGGGNMFNPTNAVDLDTSRYPIPPNVAVINGSSGGRGTFATITVRPDAIAPLLPAKAEVTPRERWILYCFCSLTSAGRKNEWSRSVFSEARQAYVRCKGPTDAELQALAARGFLKINRAGAAQITTEGRNACDRGPNGLGSVPYAE